MSQYRKPTQELIGRLHDKDLVFEFFFVFSRLEYALLRTDFFLDRNGDISVKWDGFAIHFDEAFSQLQSPELQEAVNYFLKYPPKKQVIISGNLAWADAVPQDRHQLLTLLVLVRRVRNNLFHGEKLGELLGGQSKRDADLLTHGLTILFACLDLSPELVDKFFSETRLALEEETEDEADGEVM